MSGWDPDTYPRFQITKSHSQLGLAISICTRCVMTFSVKFLKLVHGCYGGFEFHLSQLPMYVALYNISRTF